MRNERHKFLEPKAAHIQMAHTMFVSLYLTQLAQSALLAEDGDPAPGRRKRTNKGGKVAGESLAACALDEIDKEEDCLRDG